MTGLSGVAHHRFPPVVGVNANPVIAPDAREVASLGDHRTPEGANDYIQADRSTAQPARAEAAVAGADSPEPGKAERVT